MRVLITRPEPDATRLAEALRARGHEPVRVPLMTIKPSSEPPPAGTEDCVLVFTSANGVRAAARSGLQSHHGVFAVGPATAAAAQEEGFAIAGIAGGDVASLARLIQDDLSTDQRLLHVAGADRAGDLKGVLESAGYPVARWVAYRALAADRLPPDASNFLKLEGGAVALFSPRSATLLARLIQESRLSALAGGHVALCLSEAVAAESARLAWRAIRIAAQPSQEALIDLLN